jgi:hypothetical protein
MCPSRARAEKEPVPACGASRADALLRHSQISAGRNAVRLRLCGNFASGSPFIKENALLYARLPMDLAACVISGHV